VFETLFNTQEGFVI